MRNDDKCDDVADRFLPQNCKYDVGDLSDPENDKIPSLFYRHEVEDQEQCGGIVPGKLLLQLYQPTRPAQSETTDNLERRRVRRLQCYALLFATGSLW